MSLLPAIGKPGIEVICRPRGEIHQQLHEVELRIHLVPAAAAGQAGQDRCGPSAVRVSDEQRVLAVQNHTLHLPFTHIVVDRHRAISGEQISLDQVGCEARKIPAEGNVFFLDFSLYNFLAEDALYTLMPRRTRGSGQKHTSNSHSILMKLATAREDRLMRQE